MIKIDKMETYGWESAIRGMRNPMNSWGKSDSCFYISRDGHCTMPNIGPNDLELMTSLCKGGPVHAKFRRMIGISMDILAPLYWWKEFDTYKVGTVADSCSTMHKIHSKEFTFGDFSHEHLVGEFNADDDVDAFETLGVVVRCLNKYRDLYNSTGNKDYWWKMIQLLPSSYNQLRTVTMNYEVAVHMFNDRKCHKLDEWRIFCDELCMLPYAKQLIAGLGE